MLTIKNVAASSNSLVCDSRLGGTVILKQIHRLYYLFEMGIKCITTTAGAANACITEVKHASGQCFHSPSNPKYSWSMLCSSLKPGHFFHIVPIFSPILETIWCKFRKYCLKSLLEICVYRHYRLYKYYLELLAGETAAWAAGTLYPDGRCSF